MKRILFSLFVVALAAPALLYGASTTTTHRTVHHIRGRVHESAAVHRHIASLQHSERVAGAHVRSATLTTVRGAHRAYLRRTRLRHHYYYERFTASSFATTDLTAGDITAGEDPVVRQAAINRSEERRVGKECMTSCWCLLNDVM